MNGIIVAYDRNRTIGRDGDIPWMGRLPVDMKFFRETTVGHAIIMGYTTYLSLPDAMRPLPDRRNIVLSRSERMLAGVAVVHSLESALELAGDDSFIIGGASVYEHALPYVDTVLATEIDIDIRDGDAFFPKLDAAEWLEESREPFSSDGRNAYAGAFVRYMRKPQI